MNADKRRSEVKEKKKARRFLPTAAPTIPTGGKGYSTCEIIEDLQLGGNVRYRTLVTPNNVKQLLF